MNPRGTVEFVTLCKKSSKWYLCIIYHKYTMYAYILKIRISIFQESAGVDCIYKPSWYTHLILQI